MGFLPRGGIYNVRRMGIYMQQTKANFLTSRIQHRLRIFKLSSKTGIEFFSFTLEQDQFLII